MDALEKSNVVATNDCFKQFTRLYIRVDELYDICTHSRKSAY